MAETPFTYVTRQSQFVGLNDRQVAQLIDERDRQLEDYLATLARDVATLLGP